MDINLGEKRAEEIISVKLEKEIRINDEVYDLISNLFGEISGKVKDVELNPFQIVLLLLSTRLLSDLRSLRILATKGYVVSAMNIACSIFENTLIIQFISNNNNESRAKKWLEHTNEENSVWKTGGMLNDLKLKDTKGVFWKYLCMFKHLNPKIMAVLNITGNEKEFTLNPGPETTDRAFFWIGFLLIATSGWIMDIFKDVSNLFMSYHSNKENWKIDYDRIHKEIEGYLKLMLTVIDDN